MKYKMLQAALLLSIILPAEAGVPTAVKAPSLSHLSPEIRTGQEQTALSLRDAVYLGLRNNPAIRSQYIDRISQKFDLQVARDSFSPVWSIKASYQADRSNLGDRHVGQLSPEGSLLTPYGTQLKLAWNKSAEQHSRSGRQRSDGIDFSVIQPLLRGAGKEVNTAPLRQAVITENINRLTLKSTVSRSISEIIQAYHSLLRAQALQTVAREALDRAEEQLEVNRHLVSAGRMAETELLQNEASIATQQLQIMSADSERIYAEQQLLQLLGLTLKTRITATDTPEIDRTSMSVDKAIRIAEQQSPEYLSTLLDGQLIALDLVSAKDARRWSLSLQAGSREQRDRHGTEGMQRHWEHYAGLELEIPLNDRAAQQSLLRAQVAEQRHRITIGDARQELVQRIDQALRQLETSWKQYDIADRAVTLSKKNLEIEQEKLRAGRSGTFEVIRFEVDLKAVELSRLEAQMGYLSALTELDLAMGTTLDTWEVVLND